MAEGVNFTRHRDPFGRMKSYVLMEVGCSGDRGYDNKPGAPIFNVLDGRGYVLTETRSKR